MIEELQERLKDKKIQIELTNEFKNYIVENKIDLNYGARELKRKLQEIIENEIAERIICNELKPKRKIIFDIKNNQVKCIIV